MFAVHLPTPVIAVSASRISLSVASANVDFS